MAAGDLGGYGGKLGWSAGLGRWLDSPSSKVHRYWREIEFGTKGDWSGRTVAGLWGSTLGNGPLDGDMFTGSRTQKFKPAFKKKTPQTPEGMLGAARNALWVYMQGGKGSNMDKLKVRYVWVYEYYSVNGKTKRVPGSGERRAPRTAAEVRRAQQSIFHYLMSNENLTAKDIPFVQGKIMQPIEARHYYAKAIADFKPRLKEMEREGLRQAARWAIGDVKAGAEYREFRKQAAWENDASPRKGRARAETTSMEKYIPKGGAVVTMGASVQLQYSMRNGNGQFINGVFQSTLREVNARVAAAYLQEVAKRMEFHRPSTKALIEATLDRRNRYPDDTIK